MAKAKVKAAKSKGTRSKAPAKKIGRTKKKAVAKKVEEKPEKKVVKKASKKEPVKKDGSVKTMLRKNNAASGEKYKGHPTSRIL